MEYEDDNKPSNDNRPAKVKKVLDDLSYAATKCKVILTICEPLMPSVEYEGDNKPSNHDYHAEVKILHGYVNKAFASAA